MCPDPQLCHPSPHLPGHPALNHIYPSEQLTPHFCLNISPALPLTSALFPPFSFVPVSHTLSHSHSLHLLFTHSFIQQKLLSIFYVPGMEIERFEAWIQYKAILIYAVGLFACDHRTWHNVNGIMHRRLRIEHEHSRRWQQCHILARYSYLSASGAQWALRGKGQVLWEQDGQLRRWSVKESGLTIQSHST